MPAVELPAEAALLDLARRFEDAERRVRALLAEAVAGGDRRALLTEALQILVELRRFALRASPMLERAYEAAFLAVALLLGRPELQPSSEASYDLARSLTGRLDRAARTAQDGSQAAFRTVTVATLAVAATDAVTGHVDARGARRPLGAVAVMLTRTIGRHATVRGTLDAVPGQAVTIHTLGGGHCAICDPYVGNTYPAEAAPRPPYHPSCDCIAVPAGRAPRALLDAQAEAVRAAA